MGSGWRTAGRFVVILFALAGCGSRAGGDSDRYTAIGQHVGYGGPFHFHSGMTLAVRFDRNPDPLDATVVSLAQEIERTLRA